jgi:hypothetical protein
MLQIVLDHVIRHLANGGAKIAVRLKMFSPIPLFQVRKLLKQTARSPSFNSPHDFAWRPIRRCTHQNRNMIFTDHAFYNPYLKRLARLPHQVSYSLSYFTTQHLVTLLGYPNKRVFNWVNRMTYRIYSLLPPPWPNYRR